MRHHLPLPLLPLLLLVPLPPPLLLLRLLLRKLRKLPPLVLVVVVVMVVLLLLRKKTALGVRARGGSASAIPRTTRTGKGRGPVRLMSGGMRWMPAGRRERFLVASRGGARVDLAAVGWELRRRRRR